MRIAHVVLPAASAYEQKSQRVDLAALQEEHQVTLFDDPRRAAVCDVTQIYGPPTSILAGRRYVISPLAEEGAELVPEAVEERYFGVAQAIPPALAGRIAGATAIAIASFRRRSIISMVEQTFARLHRTRDDIEWLLFDQPPSPSELAGLSAWVDPAVDERDFDGFVAEALVCSRVVIAARTPINVQRLEKGRTGLLVRCGDANELSHAILAALFKPEVAQQKIEDARQTISKFRPRQRLRALMRIVEQARA
jgi:glycosyltransferase involved in cell wall biosynthesis